MPDNFRFNQVVKHGRFAAIPGKVYNFEDPDADDYFELMGWGDKTTDDADYPTIPIGIVDIDPDTVYAEGERKGLRVIDKSKKDADAITVAKQTIFGKDRRHG